jgi:hypothetical protein
MSGTTPISGALVYRLPAGQTIGGSPLADGSGRPFRSDEHGYLQGRGVITPGDQLLALAPVSLPPTYTTYYSDTMRLYYTNGQVTGTGVTSHTVNQSGVQTLTVSATNPLLLFDLDVSLEWDASYDATYLDQLVFDLERASEHLYDFTNGQVALGEVAVSQDADDWAFSHIVVHATNRLRPFAIQGGALITQTVDPEHSDIIYDIGQVHLGATWNRYGTPGQNLGGDWPLVLAHELGHYLLFLDDTYIGLNEEGLLIPIDTRDPGTGCTGTAMGDVYTPDNTELIWNATHWADRCSQTLAEQTLARNEWETVQLWYPWLQATSNPGPSLMPYEFTTVGVSDPITPTLALADPTFYLDYQAGAVSSSEARAFLLREDKYVIDLGSPVGGQNRVLARGAEPGDRLCVFDRPRGQYGCEVIASGDDRLALELDESWTPLIQLSPVTSTTFDIEVESLPGGLALEARLYPEFGEGLGEISLAEGGGVYSGTFNLAYPALAGDVQLWVNETATESNPRREAIVAYAIGGNPGVSRGGGGVSRGGGGVSRGGGGVSRGGGGVSRGGGAPLVSPDGQMIFFTADPAVFNEGEFYTVQNMAGLPPLPTGKTAIGQGYNLLASPNITRVLSGSVSFQYLGSDALAEGVDEEELTIHHWGGSGWQALGTVRDSYHNLVSAPGVGEGVYALLAGVTMTSPTRW